LKGIMSKNIDSKHQRSDQEMDDLLLELGRRIRDRKPLTLPADPLEQGFMRYGEQFVIQLPNAVSSAWDGSTAHLVLSGPRRDDGTIALVRIPAEIAKGTISASISSEAAQRCPVILEDAVVMHFELQPAAAAVASRTAAGAAHSMVAMVKKGSKPPKRRPKACIPRHSDVVLPPGLASLWDLLHECMRPGAGSETGWQSRQDLAEGLGKIEGRAVSPGAAAQRIKRLRGLLEANGIDEYVIENDRKRGFRLVVS